MKKNIVFGAVIGAILLYFSFRGIDFEAIAACFRSLKAGYIVPVLIVLLLVQLIRSYRWGVLLSPIVKLDQFSLFSITNVGALALIIIPARIGELARPYLVSGKANIRLTAALGTVFIERVFDCLSVLLIFFVILLFTPLPVWLVNASLVFLGVTLGVLGFILLLIFRREPSLRMFDRFTGILPARWGALLNRVIHHFIDGIEIITDPKLILNVSLLSILIWFLHALVIYILFQAFGFNLSVLAALIVMVILIIGITIPTAPGYIGNWHFFCVLGLTLFGISKADALTYAIIFHFISLGFTVVLGAIFLPFNHFRLSDLRVDRK
ncbi:MAG: lysylphosphatidylglycerol synthase transmembrane domain-containing protein [Syntrophales bacterium]